MLYGRESAIARFYDGDYDHFRTPSGDVAFYVEEARRSGGPVLELGCGTGRILVPTARAGVAIAGVDLSEAMLAVLGAKLPGADVRLGDMRNVDLGRRFALVTIPFRALAHVLEAEDHVRIFENARRHLAPGGRLLFDLYQPDPRYLVGPRDEKLDIERTEGGRTIRRYSAAVPHPWRQVNDVTFRWEVLEGGRTEEYREEFPMRWFYRYELEHALARAGLRVEALYGGFDRSPLGPASKELIFLARPS
jgi:SAM-dependent methyltransferase